MSAPRLLAVSNDAHGAGTFYQGCRFSPDGLCVLTCTSGDARLRLYNTIFRETDAWSSTLTARGVDAVRDYCWYPAMRSTEAASCCFAAVSRHQPLHLFDAYTGQVRATYRPYNRLDEFESPTALAFSVDGGRLLTGGFTTDRMIQVFDLSRPGRDSVTWKLGKSKRSSDGQKGLVSSLCVHDKYVAIGTYAPGSIYVYDDRSGATEAIVLSGLAVVGHGKSHARKKRLYTDLVALTGEDNDANANLTWLSTAKSQWYAQRTQTGVTQLLIMQDYLLYSAARRTDAVLCWDLRMLSGNDAYQSHPVRGIGSFARAAQSQQRIRFCLNESGTTLYTGGLDGCVRVYDTQSGDQKSAIVVDGCSSRGVVNSASHASVQEQNYLAVATGDRQFPSEDDLENGLFRHDAKSGRAAGALMLYKLS